MPTTETVTRYEWPAESVIRRIDVRHQKNGFAVAYLYADPAEEKQALRQNIRAAIRLKGWGTLSDSKDGQFVLRVTGLRDGEALIAALQNEKLIGAPQGTQAIDEHPEPPKTLGDKIRANSLRYSGLAATFGNALAIVRGLHRAQVEGKRAETGKALAFAAADLPLAIAGNRDDSRQLVDFLRQLKKHYEKNGIEIPSTASIYIETSDRGKTVGERSMDFMHRYANQIKCGFEVVAAYFSIKAGKEQKLWPKRVAPFFWGTGFLASGIIPERKVDPEQYASAGLLGRAWMKIQSNPLSLGGTLGWTNNAADYYSAYMGREEWIKGGRNGPPLHLWDVAVPTSMVGANGLYAISKKTVGGDIKNDAMVHDAYRIASQIINKQPPELRDRAVELTARFFGERTEMKEHYAEAKARLVQELGSQRENPWFEPLGLGTYDPKQRRPHRDAAPQPTNGLAEAATPETPGTRVQSVAREAPQPVKEAAASLGA